jgi:hypothetical protein
MNRAPTKAKKQIPSDHAGTFAGYARKEKSFFEETCGEGWRTPHCPLLLGESFHRGNVGGALRWQ